LRRCPLKSQYSFCALQQLKCFKAVSSCIVCTPIPVEGKGLSVSRQPILHFAEKGKGPSMKDKTCRTGCGRAKDTVDLQRASPQPTAFFPIVLTAFLQRSMCVVFDYYWCMFWVWEGWGREGDG
jgi:hypothetical protein